VLGVADVWVCAAREEMFDAGDARVLRRDAQRLTTPHLVVGVDRGSRCEQLIDGSQALMVGGHHERADARLRGRVGTQPPGDIARRGGLLDAVYAGTGRDQDVEHVGRAEHCGVQQRRAAGNAAGVVGRSPLEIGTGGDQDLRDLGVAVAGGS
jgi:hypothetical protein